MADRVGNARQPFEMVPEKIDDEAAREGQDRIRQFLDGILFSRFDGDHFAITITRNAGQTTRSFPHGFRFVPKDIWFTSQIPTSSGESVSVVYSSVNSSNIVFDLSGLTVGEPIKLRFFAGVFTEKV